MDRAEEFIKLFNRVQLFLSQLVGSDKNLSFSRLVEDVSKFSPVVKAKSSELKQFGKLRNAIVHDSDFPTQIIAVPSQEALERFAQISKVVFHPEPLMPTFRASVHCFSESDSLASALSFMRMKDFSQTVVRNDDGRLAMLTVEGITNWLADSWKGNGSLADRATVANVISVEPPDCFKIMGPCKTIFDAADAFKNSIHRQATRLYAIIITENGGDRDDPLGLVTPWDLVHNPRLRQELE